jgi:hypothetical protein
MDDEYNWDDWDNQANEYLGSDDYTGGIGEADTGNNWGPPQENQQYDFYQPQPETQPEQYQLPSWQDNIDAGGGWNPATGQGDVVQYPGLDAFGGGAGNQFVKDDWRFQENPNRGWMPSATNSGGAGMDWAGLLGKIFGSGGSGSSGGGQVPGQRNNSLGGVLGDLFGNNNTGAIDNVGNLVSRVLPFFAANEEKKSSEEYRRLAEEQLQSSQGRMDPFAGERRQYMDRLLGASDRLEGIYNNPMSSAMYAQSKNEMERRIPRQMSKNRFSMGVNRAMSQQAPELMKQALDDSRKTFDMYKEPAGANIRPNDNAAILQAVLGAQKGSLTNPMWSAGGQFLQGNNQQAGGNDAMNQILSFLAKNSNRG